MSMVPASLADPEKKTLLIVQYRIQLMLLTYISGSQPFLVSEPNFLP